MTDWDAFGAAVGMLLMAINPVPKILLLSMLPERLNLRRTVVAGTLFAGAILAVAVVIGVWFLPGEPAVKAAGALCGAGLIWTGGRLWVSRCLPDCPRSLAIWPLACPMIAGPNVVLLCMVLGGERGWCGAGAALAAALVVNAAAMYAAAAGMGRLVSRIPERRLRLVAGAIVAGGGAVLLLQAVWK